MSGPHDNGHGAPPAGDEAAGAPPSAAGESDGRAHPPGARARRLVFGMNTLVSIALAALLLAMVNYLSARHYLRADVSRSHPYALSAKTRQLLAGLSNRVDAILFIRPNHGLYGDAEALLREYESACPRLHVEHVDPDREQARAVELMKRFNLVKANVVVFHSGDRSVVVNDLDLIELDTSGSEAGIPPRRGGFLGEQAFSTALLQLSMPRRPAVYFVLGHGERDPRDHDRFTGFSEVARHFADDHIEVRPLLLAQSNTVPADADAVVIAGPRHRFATSEVGALRDYLARNGRVLLLLDTRSDAGLAGLLEEWGVRVGAGLVMDAGHSLSGVELFINDYAPHPITSPMTNVTVVLQTPRPLEILNAAGADKPRVVPLLHSPSSAWAESDLENRSVAFDAGQDRRGPFAVALAVEKGAVSGVDMDIRPTRLVVLGDARFACNGSLVGGNPDLLLNAINWLLERQDLLSIAAKPLDRIRLVMDQRQLGLLFAAVVVVLPALVALAGLLVWMRRRF